MSMDYCKFILNIFDECVILNSEVMQVTVGERIQAARKNAGMKQSELAEKLGVAVVTIGQYERGKRQPRLEQLEAIAAALGVEPWELSGHTGIRIPMPEYPLPVPTQEQVDRMTQPELEYYYLRLLADSDPDDLKGRYLDNYEKLNKLGRVEAVIRTKELTRLHEYTDRDSRAPAPPESPLPAPESTDTTPEEMPPESP